MALLSALGPALILLAFQVSSWPDCWFLVLLGGACSVIAWRVVPRWIREDRHLDAFDSEWHRARAEWSELGRAADAARAQGVSLEQMLCDRGYRVPGVIAAIQHDLTEESR
ncbi:MAG: hypothetical protein NXI31_22335 [bacterium]|nr:hypothetical protein [bacterium]